MQTSVTSLKHEIIVFHLMGENDIKLNYGKYTALEDLETGESIRIDQHKISALYQANLSAHLQAIKTFLLDRNVYYRLLTLNQPLDEALRDFLNQRNKISR